MDKFFDALNVHYNNHGYHSNKEFQEPYEKKDQQDNCQGSKFDT